MIEIDLDTKVRDHDEMAHTRLFAAVLQLGMRDAAHGFARMMKLRDKNPDAKAYDIISKDNNKANDYARAYHWLVSDLNEPFSFVWLCEVFKIDPNRARSQWRMNVRKLCSSTV